MAREGRGEGGGGGGQRYQRRARAKIPHSYKKSKDLPKSRREEEKEEGSYLERTTLRGAIRLERGEYDLDMPSSLAAITLSAPLPPSPLDILLPVARTDFIFSAPTSRSGSIIRKNGVLSICLLAKKSKKISLKHLFFSFRIHGGEKTIMMQFIGCADDISDDDQGKEEEEQIEF